MRIFSTKIVDDLLLCSYFVLMSLESIGEAYSLGWRVIARCKYGRPDGAGPKSKPRVWSSPRTRYGNASVDARARFPSLSTGKPVEMPEMRKQKYHCDVSTACARGVSMITECFQIYKSARALPRSHYQFCGSPQLKSFSRSPNKTDAQQ